MGANTADRVYLYDSTLRDGAQARGVDFTLSDKLAIAKALDQFGIDYIEGGFPGANPKDDAFFEAPPKLQHARLTAFGMTRRAGRSAANDPGLAAVLASGARSVCLVGKAWAHQVETALGISQKENLRVIEDSIAHAARHVKEVLFDAEHFFDGYLANPTFALACLSAAHQAGARWLVLCDTNGGHLPHTIERVVSEVVRQLPGAQLGIHCHNDTDSAVANSLAAVRAGVRQVQGTINGVGERCGNANLISIIPALVLKLGFTTGVSAEKMPQLTALSRLLDERLSRAPNPHAPYVGSAAFAHKGGLHVSAMAKDSTSYEHITPAAVGNRRTILVSDKSGKATVTERLADLGMQVAADHPGIATLVHEIKQRETQGYAYDGADASFELLARRLLDEVPEYFSVQSFRVIDERRWNAKGKLVTLSEATIKLTVGEELIMTVAEGNGPVNALDSAVRQALVKHHPAIKDMVLTDYKVRILTPSEGTKALTRVFIESRDSKGRVWTTIGVSPNVIDASFNALHDAITYKLWLANTSRTAATDHRASRSRRG